MRDLEMCVRQKSVGVSRFSSWRNPSPATTIFPLGVIVNELLTNTMKYVFIGKETGSVPITAALKEGRVLFAIEGAVVGIREQDDPDKSKGSALMLVNMLVEQLNGVFTFDRKQ